MEISLASNCVSTIKGGRYLGPLKTGQTTFKITKLSPLVNVGYNFVNVLKL